MKSSEEKKKFWQEHLDNWKSSGISRRKYCEENGINANTFGYWIQRIRKLGKTDSSFVCLNIGNNSDSTFEITIKNKYTIKVNNNYSSESLQKLIRTLEAV